MGHEKTVIMMVCAMVSIACVETIVMDPHERDLPVMVNCVLNTDLDNQTLSLQYVHGKAEKEYIPVENARVFITGPFRDTLFFHKVEGPRWEAQLGPGMKGMSGHFHLSVEIPGRKTIISETEGPIKFYPIVTADYLEDNISHLTMAFGMSNGLSPDVKSGPVWIRAMNQKHSSDEETLNRFHYLATDSPYADDFNVNGKHLSDLDIVGEVAESDHEYYNWMAFKNMKRLMPNLNLHDDFIRMECIDTTFYHIVAGPLNASVDKNTQRHFDFVFVSDDLDKYLRTVYAREIEMDHSLAKIYSMENTFSNIEGGVGIFGSCVITHAYYSL